MKTYTILVKNKKESDKYRQIGKYKDSEIDDAKATLMEYCNNYRKPGDKISVAVKDTSTGKVDYYGPNSFYKL